MKKWIGLAALLLIAAPGIGQQEAEPYFSLSASRTFASNTPTTINLTAFNVSSIEFRVYRVNDAVKFFEQLENPHVFGGQTPRPRRERTVLEQLRGWKRGLRASIRRELRAQFTEPPHNHIEALASSQPKPASREIRYAQAPVLNSQQLVLTFQQPVTTRQRWASQVVDIGVREKGVYLVEAVNADLNAYTIVTVSDLVVTSKTARGRILNFVADRASGEPIEGAEVSMVSPGRERVSAKTSAEGIAELPLEGKPPENVRVVAHNGNDFAANILESYSLVAGEDRWMGYIYSDRPVYRPGHTVQFKGIFRARTLDGYKVPDVKTVSATIHDAAGKDAYQKTLTLNANGTVSDKFVLPNDAALGYYSIQIQSGDNHLNGSFEVEEYKKPEYEVRVTATQPRILQGATNTLVVDAKYYFGEPVNGASVHYSVYRSRYWFPLWHDPDDDAEDNQEYDGGYDGEEISQGEGTLSEDGKLTVSVPALLANERVDHRYRVQARVTDAARREITGSGTFVATYGSFVLNVSPDRYFYSPGARAAFAIEARNYDSMPVQTPVRVELLQWNWQKPEQSVVTVATDASTGANGAGAAELTIPNTGGSYRVRVTARTPEGRDVETYGYVWVSGRGGSSEFQNPRRTVEIVPDKKTYRPGEMAHVLIATGMPQTPVLVSVEGRDLRLHRVMRSEDATVTFEVPVTERDEPGLFVTAQYTRDGNLYRSSKYIRVPPEEHKLNIAVSTDKPQYQPGDTALYNLQATDASGRPVAGAELSLGIVDEAIYAVRSDPLPDPLRYFFGREWNTVFTSDSLNYYFSGDAGKKRMQLAQLREPSKLAQLKPERLVLPKVRKAFPDTAFWAADIVTDAQGRAQAKVALPDSLTTWRATTRGVTPDTKVGAAVIKNITRKNVILRLSVPRFFVRGDEVVISAIVHNYLEDAKDAKVSLEVTGLEVVGGATKTVPVPARGEVRVDWRVRAANVGLAKITGRALTNQESDALELEIPVNAPGVPLSMSKGGSFSAGGSTMLDLAFPERVEAGSRRMSIRVSPSIAGALFGAVEYLTSFPYGCVEQTMSSFLPNIIVQQTVRDLGLKVTLNQSELREKISDGLDRLYAFQHADGGWGWWETDETHPFMTAYVTAGLQQARDSGAVVREDVIEKGAKWIDQTLASSPRLAPDLRAYMAYALGARMDPTRLTALYDDRSRMSPYGLALLGLALEQRKDARAAEVAAALERSVQQDPEQAWWPAERDEMLDFTADATPEASAFAVRFLSHQRPQSPLLPKAAVWLMNHRNEGYWWSSTKQTAMVIYGLTDYLKVTKELNPNFTVNVAVNGRQALSRKFDQATGPDAPALVLPERDLQPGSNHIQITTSGSGRLYYSARAEYSSSEERLERTGTVALNILREYFRLMPTKSGEKIVYDTVPLNGPVASGDVVAVRLTVTGSEWRYLLVEDPIPAGTEFIERDQNYELRNRPPWWGYYFTRREMHDDRMAIFETYFPRGQQDYFYLLKVVNPGKFSASPARVQPMYQPGVMATTGRRELEVQ